MSSIIKTFFGKHIDLDKIIAISNVEWYGGDEIYFSIDCQLRDEPIVYEEHILHDHGEYSYEGYEKHKLEPAKKELQIKIDEFIKQWKAYKND